MSYHDRIMNFHYPEGKPSQFSPRSEQIAYKEGHRDARHAAAELAIQADETIRCMSESWQKLADMLGVEVKRDGLDVDEMARAIEGLKRDAARYRWLNDTLHSAKAGAGVEVNDELMCYEQPEPGKEVRVYWYPDTPIGFYEVQASTLDQAIDKALAAGEAG